MLELMDKYVNEKLEELSNKKIKIIELLENVHKECKYNAIYNIVLERLFQLAIKKNIALNSIALLKILNTERLDNDFIVIQTESKQGYYNISPNQFLKKGTIFNVLKALKLEKSKAAFIYLLMKKNEEFKDTKYMEYCKENKLTNFEEVFEKERKEMYGNKEIIKIV